MKISKSFFHAEDNQVSSHHENAWKNCVSGKLNFLYGFLHIYFFLCLAEFSRVDIMEFRLFVIKIFTALFQAFFSFKSSVIRLKLINLLNGELKHAQMQFPLFSASCLMYYIYKGGSITIY